MSVVYRESCIAGRYTFIEDALSEFIIQSQVILGFLNNNSLPSILH